MAKRKQPSIPFLARLAPSPVAGAITYGGWSRLSITPPDIALARKDNYARRFFNKSYTRHDDLLGAVSFWLACNMPRKSLKDFLQAIVPPSNWSDDPDFDPSKHGSRPAELYGDDFRLLIEGYWHHWKED